MKTEEIARKNSLFNNSILCKTRVGDQEGSVAGTFWSNGLISVQRRILRSTCVVVMMHIKAVIKTRQKNLKWRFEQGQEQGQERDYEPDAKI